MQNTSAMSAPQFGAFHVKPPRPLRFPPSPLIFSPMKDHADGTSLSMAASTSQGDSRLHSGTDSSSAPQHRFHGGSHGLSFGSPHVQLSVSASVTTNTGEERNVAFLGGSQAPLDLDDEADVSSGSIQNHEDSFYASLRMAQQLTQQKDLTKQVSDSQMTRQSSRGSAFTSTAAGRDSNSTTSATRKSLSPALKPSRAPSVLSGASIDSVVASQPPRTLQDLLAWRQELIMTRIKEQQQQQQQQQQRRGSLEYSSSLGHGSQGTSEAGDQQQQQQQKASRGMTLLAPQVLSPPFLSLGSPQASSRMSSAHSPTMPTEAESDSDDEDSTNDEFPMTTAPAADDADVVTDSLNDAATTTTEDGERRGEKEETVAPTSEPCEELTNDLVMTRLKESFCSALQPPPSMPVNPALPQYGHYHISHCSPQQYVHSALHPHSTMSQPPPSPCFGPPQHSSASAQSSPGMMGRSTPRWIAKRDYTPREQEVSEYMRLHDNDVGQSLIGRFGLLFLLFLILSIIFDAPYLPGGMWGIF